MLVADIMTENPITANMDDTLRVVVDKMNSINCHRLPVCNKEGALVGIITDGDTRQVLHSPFASNNVAQNEALLDTVKVRQFMTPAPYTVEPTMDISNAIHLMLEYRIGGLPVLKGETVIGIVTSTDVLAAFARYLKASEPQA